jgi:hypothetical protein
MQLMTTSYMYSHVANQVVFVFKSPPTIQAWMFRFLTTFKTNMSTERDHPAIHFLAPRTRIQLFASFYSYTQSRSLLRHHFSTHKYFGIMDFTLHIKQQVTWNSEPRKGIRLDGRQYMWQSIAFISHASELIKTVWQGKKQLHFNKMKLKMVEEPKNKRNVCIRHMEDNRIMELEMKYKPHER